MPGSGEWLSREEGLEWLQSPWLQSASAEERAGGQAFLKPATDSALPNVDLARVALAFYERAMEDA